MLLAVYGRARFAFHDFVSLQHIIQSSFCDKAQGRAQVIIHVQTASPVRLAVT